MPSIPSTTATSPLDLLRQRKDGAGQSWIGPASFLAGERLRADLQAGGILPKVTMDWSRSPQRGAGGGSGALNPTEAAIAARSRVHRALDAVGPDFAGVLVDLCGFDKGLEALERERNWPVRSGKVVVKLALAALARHYGYSDAAAGHESGRTRTWSAPGPRPSVRAVRSGAPASPSG